MNIIYQTRLILNETLTQFGRRFFYTADGILKMEKGRRKIPSKIEQFCLNRIYPNPVPVCEPLDLI